MNQPTTQQLADDNAVQVLSNEGAQCGDCGDQPGDRTCPDCERCRRWYVAALRKAGWAPQDEHAALVAEIHRLRARVTVLEEAGTYARSALAALCYDLEDPGSNALGALYLLQQATLTVDAPKDDTSAALLQHACKVLHGVADIADPEPPEVSFFGPTFGPQVAAWLRMLAARPAPTP